MIPKLTKVVYACHCRIMAEFSDRTRGEADLTPVLRGDLLRPLREPALFRQVSLDAAMQCVVWPSGASIPVAVIHRLLAAQEKKRDETGKWHTDYYWMLLERDHFEEGWPCITAPEWAGTPFAQRRLFFEFHRHFLNLPRTCPCCGYPTLRERARNKTCSICDWIDDGQDDPFAYDGNQHGYWYSLAQSRRNFASGAFCRSMQDIRDAAERDRVFDQTAIALRHAHCMLYDSLLLAADPDGLKKRWKQIKRQVPGDRANDMTPEQEAFHLDRILESIKRYRALR